MSRPQFIKDPKITHLIGGISSLLKSKKIFLSRKRHIIFLCGGSNKNSARIKFIKYALQHLPDLTIFLAENATKDLISHDNPGFINLSDFETVVADIADCIILFPETPGAIAELGLFSGSSRARKKLLVVNDEQFQSQDSFINRGPIETIDKKSQFRSRVILDLTGRSPKFSHVKEKLTILGKLRNRATFSHQNLKDMSRREKMFVILEVVNLFRMLSLQEIQEVIEVIFGKLSSGELRNSLSILFAAGYVKRSGPDEKFFAPTNPPHSFFDYEGFLEDVNGLKLQIMDYYQSTDSDRFNLLGE